MPTRSSPRSRPRSPRSYHRSRHRGFRLFLLIRLLRRFVGHAWDSLLLRGCGSGGGGGGRGHRLLLDHDALALALAGTSVGVGPLPAHGQTLPMADAAIAADIHEALDAHGHLAAQVALDLVLAIDDVAHPRRFLVAPGLDPLAGVDPGVGEDLPGGRDTDPVDVLDRDLAALVARQVHSGNACHTWLSCSLALALLVARILADDAHDALAPHDLAMLAPNLDGRSHLHLMSFRTVSPLTSGRPVPSALGRPSARNAFRTVSPLTSGRPYAFGTRS